MHEFSIIQSLFKILEKTASEKKLSRISKVRLKIGDQRQIISDFLKFAFNEVAKNTIAKGAELVIEEVPIKMGCKKCDLEFLLKDYFFICPDCGGKNLELLAGNEIFIEEVEGEVDNEN